MVCTELSSVCSSWSPPWSSLRRRDRKLRLRNGFDRRRFACRLVEAGHGFADLQPLERVVGNARIVSLGEATHGTREFFQLKHRLLSLDATLGAARIPAFALDWRQAPLAGRGVLVGPWMNEPKKTRWVGSTYFENAPDNFWVDLRPREAFDVTLFIDMTTAARSNPR